MTLPWFGLICLGFPAPHVDDVWYLDPAIGVATSGELVAPALARVLAEFGSLRFFLSFPLYPYLLGAWLSVGGVSASAVLTFWIACGASSSFALDELLLAFGVPSALRALVFAYFALHFQACGLRPELVGYPFALGGAALLLRPTRFRCFAGCAFVGFAAASAPNFVVAAPGLALTVLYPQRRAPGLPARLLVAGSAAALLVGACFWLAIRGHSSEFVAQVRLMSRVTMGKGQSVAFIVGQIAGRGWAKLRMGPLYALFLPTLPLALTGRLKHLDARGRALVLGVGGTLFGSMLYRARSFDVVNPALFASLAVVTPALSRLTVRRLATAALGVAMLSSSLVDLLCAALRGPPPTLARFASIRARAAQIGHPVVLDEYTARYVFDYRYPPGAISFHHQRALDHPLGFEARSEFKVPGETWVTTRASLCRLTPQLASDACPHQRLLGRDLGAVFADLRTVTLLE